MAIIETIVDSQSDLSVFTVNGELTADEIIERVEEYYIKHPTKQVLWIMGDVDLSAITREEIERIIQIAKKNTGKRKEGKTAIVGSKDVEYGLARMYEAYRV
jgi:2-phospho-L-lactate guanylyltransferase (CobY/MobA/RfbA family)